MASSRPERLVADEKVLGGAPRSEKGVKFQKSVTENGERGCFMLVTSILQLVH